MHRVTLLKGNEDNISATQTNRILESPKGQQNLVTSTIYIRYFSEEFASHPLKESTMRTWTRKSVLAELNWERI